MTYCDYCPSTKYIFGVIYFTCVCPNSKVILKLLMVCVWFLKTLAQNSPCPKYFLFEPDKSEDDRWFGLITLTSPVDTTSVSLELHFDKPVIQLGNWFGKVEPNNDHTAFTIKYDKLIKANAATKVEIYAVFDPYYDIPAPQLTRIVFNGREICPKEEMQQTGYPTAITININFPMCGIKTINPTALITNGAHTVEGAWPWHAGLFKLEGTRRVYICGGTLISEKHILTAAHCTTVTGKGGTTVPRESNKVSITLGKYGIYVYGKHEQNVNVLDIIVHPNFNPLNLHNDISIITIQNPVKFTDYVKPICLWEEDANERTVVNKTGTVVGWGRDEKNNAVSDLLMEAKMPVVDRLTCVLSQGSYYTKFTNDNTLCAGFRNGTSVCNGDSGGGLVFPKQGTSGIDTVWQIRGIVSNTVGKAGNVCDPKYYVVFTDVAKYLEWIKQSTNLRS